MPYYRIIQYFHENIVLSCGLITLSKQGAKYVVAQIHAYLEKL